MALTREYKQTVVARIQRDPKFARALYAEALNALLEGETDEGLSMLRDLVHAEITFKELARQTKLGEKALHRMLSRHGNPTTRNLVAILKAIREDLRIKPRVSLAA
jgi:DNA-binding phage protein